MAETFREALGQSESGGDYNRVNTLGYSGKYQWGPARLADYNKAKGTNYSMEDFLADSAVQEDAQAWHEDDIMKYVFDNGLDRYIGKTVAGVTMTPEAMKAMAHLGGKSGMKNFVESGGEYNPEDAYGTSLRDYAQKFSTGQAYDRSERLMSGEPLDYGSSVPEGGTAGSLISAFEMMNEGSPEYCPAGYYYDVVSQSCVSISAVQSSPRPKPAPERGASLQRFGLSSLA